MYDKKKSFLSNLKTLHDLKEFYEPKFKFNDGERIASAGSCFAQEITRFLKKTKQVAFLDYEKAPFNGSVQTQKKYGYGLYSARYQNIYTTAQLLQLAEEALSGREVNYVWLTKDKKFIDNQRPSIEPSGFSSIYEISRHREFHLSAVNNILKDFDCFIFTLGLTEGWLNKKTGDIVASYPGAANISLESDYEFKNYNYTDVYNQLKKFIDITTKNKAKNQTKKFIFTVSPVPLVATATNNDCLTATVHSKSVLRAVAGQLASELDNVEYFPSFEMATNPWLNINFFEHDRRTVKKEGVEMIMELFSHSFGLDYENDQRYEFEERIQFYENEESSKVKTDELICDEILLEKFNQ